MKKKSLLFLCVALVVALIPAFFVQANATLANLQFTLNEDGNSYTITKISPYSNYANIELTLPEFYNELPVTAVAAGALKWNADSFIDSIFINKNITFVDESNFKNSGIMFTAAPDNEYYYSQDGMLYNKDMTILYKCPTTVKSEVVVVPDTVETINNYAFYKIGGTAADHTGSMVNEVVLPSSVKEIGDYAFYFSVLDKLSFSEGLEKIGDSAFCISSIKDFSLPDSLKYVGDYAFSDMWCDTIFRMGPRVENINSTTFFSMARDNCVFDFDEDSKYAFYENGVYSSDLKELFWYSEFTPEKVVFSDNLEIIHACAVYGLKNIPEIEFPKTLKEIGDSAFSNSDITADIILNEGLVKIGASAFYKNASENIVVPESVEFIGESAFGESSALKTLTFMGDNIFALTGGEGCLGSNCTIEKLTAPMDDAVIAELKEYRESLKTIVLTGDDTEVPEFWFSGMSFLEEIVLPDTIISIGEFAFNECKNLKRFNIPLGVTEIKAGTFQNCSKLESITINNTIEAIGEQAFACCGIKEIIIPDSVTSIGAYAFFQSNVERVLLNNTIEVIPESCFESCGGLEYIKIPDVVTEISTYAFIDCQSLANVVLGNNVKTIGEAAFASCYRLENVNFPDSLETISKDAFEDCVSLSKADLNSGLVTIGADAFSECLSLTEINIPATVQDFTVTSYFYEELTSLQAINVEDGSTLYSSQDGVLFSVDKSTLLLYPMAKTDKKYRVPEGTELIAENSFTNNSILEELVIPSTVTTVQDTLKMLDSLKRVFVPKEVTEVNIDFLGANSGAGKRATVVYCELNSYIHTFAVKRKLNCAIIFNEYLIAAPNKSDVTFDENTKMITTKQLQVYDLDEVFTAGEDCYFDVDNGENNIYYGTGTIIKVKDYNENILDEYTLVVEGDVNGDGVCDVIDAMLVYMEITAPGEVVSESGALAADLSKTGTIDMSDYQAVVNTCLGLPV